MSWKAFLDGMARVFDLCGVYDPPLRLSSLEDDIRALYQDQLAVAQDFTPEETDELDRS